MNVIRAIFKRDLRGWFGNPTGYVFITLFVFLAAFALIGPSEFFRNNLANLDTLNEWYRVLLLFFVPAVTMGVWSTERTNGTDELLFTLPATDAQIVIGKFLAAAAVYTIALVFTFPLLLGLAYLGNPDWGLMFANYLGYWLLGLALISVGMVGSQLSQNLTVSFILAALLCAIVVYSDGLVSGLSPGLGRAWSTYGPWGLFQQMGRGIVSMAAILLFAGTIVTFLYMNLLLLSRRHWLAERLEGWHRSLRFVGLLIGVIGLAVFGLNKLGRADVTSEQIHSLSGETTKLIAELKPERPVYIQAFISEEVPRDYVQTRRTVLNLLNQYDALGGEAVQVRVVPTAPFTDAASEAEANFGIQPQKAFSEEGAAQQVVDVYMGLAFQCGTEEVVVPFMDRRMPVEYEITRSIRVVASTERRKIGVLQTDVDMFGGFDFENMRQRPEWDFVAELKLQYDVERVDAGKDYPEGLNVLLAPMASSLTQEQLDRLAAWVKAGHPTLLIDDPVPFSAPGTAPDDPKGGPRNPMMNRGQPPPEPKGDFRTFLDGIDIRWNPTDIVWNQNNPHPELEMTDPEVVFTARGLGTPQPFNPDSPITSGLQEIVTLFGGHVTDAGSTVMRFVPLLQNGSRASGTIDKNVAFRRSFSPFGGGPQLDPGRPFLLDPRVKTLACRVQGKPAGGDKDIDVIFVPDLDMVGSVFFGIRKRGLGNTSIEFDNVTFILNCVDALAGDESFVELRKRRPQHRSLTRIEREQEDYNEEWLREKHSAEQQAQAELAKAQARLDDKVKELENNPELDQRAKEIQIETIRNVEQRRLDLAKAAINDAKDRAIKLAEATRRGKTLAIQRNYKVATLASMPLPAIAIGILVFLRRRKRERAIVPGSRTVGEAK